MRDNSSVIFYLKRYMLLTKRAHESVNFQTLTVPMKINQIPYVIFETTS